MPIDWFDGVQLCVEAALSAATGETPTLNANPTFEDGVSPWLPRNCTLDQSSVWAYQGAYSLRLTPDGVASSAYAESELDPVVAGVQYQALGNVWAPTAWGNVIIGIAWYGASGWMFTVEAPVSLAAGVATPLSCVATAPPAATHATVVLFLGGFPPASQVTYFDAATLSVTSTGYGLWDSGRWESATWGPDEQFVDISARVRSIKTERKMSRDVDIWAAGTATVVLLNQDGALSPSNPSSPYVVAGVTSVRPWRPIRIRAIYGGVTYDIYRGYALDWLETWDPSDAVATVTVPCVDEWGRLARVGGFAVAPVGAGELSGRRVHRILDNAGYTGVRDIDPGRVTLQATDLSKNATDELKIVADSEGGAVYVGADGAVVFEHQYALMEETRSNTVQVTFVDDHNAGQGLPVHDMVKSYGGQLLANIAPFKRVGGVEQVVDDPTSRALYGDMAPDKRTDLICETDTQVRALATLYVQVHKDPEDRVAQLVVKPRANPAAIYPQLLARRVRDLVRVIRSPRTGDYTIDQPGHVAGISHDIVRDDWTVTVDLSSATVYQTYSTSRWDVGKWDSAAFFF